MRVFLDCVREETANKRHDSPFFQQTAEPRMFTVFFGFTEAEAEEEFTDKSSLVAMSSFKRPDA